ncbi:MAG: acyl-CoA dehydratase activase-related protein [Myxococcota bacterium]
MDDIPSSAPRRFLGLDVGAESVKIAEVLVADGAVTIGRRLATDHHKDPAAAVARLCGDLDWATVTAAAATGRGARMLNLPRVPTKAALGRGVRHAFAGLLPCTVVSIGAHGFSVLELSAEGQGTWRENSRCSQGTGNFLRQLVERFDLDVETASAMCADVAEPAALSGRCPVILKTDMTHLANKGEDHAAILAGLYDAVCENVQVLIRPRGSPPTLLLAGGVARAPRVQASFDRYAAAHGLRLARPDAVEDVLFLEALGAAHAAASHPTPPPPLRGLLAEHEAARFERLPGLAAAMPRVVRMPAAPLRLPEDPREVVLGFDIGSTGSKAVALDAGTRTPIWQAYTSTLGNPVGAARGLAERFLAETEGRHAVVAVGATGSGREIVGSLMSACFGSQPVYVLNEIAAHATGALWYDPDVDTLFEIGGQDAKYVRLDGGRIADAAMNEACSAGTGSFIEEQGKKFEGVDDVVALGRVALEAGEGISLGQHCSVFMAEVIDEAVSAGEDRATIVAGIYDSIVQNYLNRVKGNRTIGQRIFCQGMPFSADALAAAVARQTGRTVVVPPHPGTIGALGIALLAHAHATRGRLDLGRFCAASVDRKDTFACPSTKGCGGAGNKCRIDRITATVEGRSRKFLWGGGCSLYDAGTRARKLPDLAPDPFRERAALVDAIVAKLEARPGRPTVAVVEEFALKGLFPFFATFLDGLGWNVRVARDAGHATLKRGIEEASVPWCAPMQLFVGSVAELAAGDPDVVMAPRVRELPRNRAETHAVTCPIVQASPDVVRRHLPPGSRARFVAPRVDMGEENLDSLRFFESARRVAGELGVGDDRLVGDAFAAGVAAQRAFERSCRRIGESALAFAREHGLVAVVVLGRPYTIHNDVLNSNVPALLREQGAVAIPVDCYPIADDAPVFDDLYWGHSQTNLRAAWQVRREEGVYAVYCSNYSCGPDSFNLHFFAYTMEGRPFAVIETDGHAGDAGTRTRIEAFLFCVEGDRRLPAEVRAGLARTDLKAVESRRATLPEVKERREILLVPRMGPGAEVAAAVLRAEGLRAEALPMPDHDALRLGRRHTSGKECIPMTITAGSLLTRLAAASPEDRFAFFMPTARGPCRFGVYNLLHKLILERTGNGGRVRVVSPDSGDYFAGVSSGLRVRFFVSMLAQDMLLAGLHDARPVERVPGAAREVYDRFFGDLVRIVEATPPMAIAPALAELAGPMFGIRALVREAGRAFAAAKDPARDVPTVAVVGEIYVRLDPFANGFVVEELERRGLRALLAPFTEWIEYTTLLGVQRAAEDRAFPGDRPGPGRFSYAVQAATADRLWGEMAASLGWGARTTVDDALAASRPWLSDELWGEAVLTLGGPLHEHAHGQIDGVVSVGPHECMPNKIAEAQFAASGEHTGLLSLTLPLTGDPLDPEVLDRFAWEVHERARKGRPARPTHWGPLWRRALLQSLHVMRVVPAPRAG